MFWATFFDVVKQLIFGFLLFYAIIASVNTLFDRTLPVELNRWPYVVIFVVCVILMAIAVR